MVYLTIYLLYHSNYSITTRLIKTHGDVHYKHEDSQTLNIHYKVQNKDDKKNIYLLANCCKTDEVFSICSPSLTQTEVPV